MNNQHPGELPSEPPKSATGAHSTGPRTPAGKAVSSQNARKHDLCSRTLRLAPEEWAEYNDMGDRYRRDLQPEGDIEQTLVDEICFNYWRLQQAREAEFQIMTEHSTEFRVIALYLRYRTGYERGFYKALDKLQQTQRIRKQTTKSPPLRSAKQSAAPAPLPSGDVSDAALRSADSESSQAAALADQLEDHILENRVRGDLALPPLELPNPLLDQLRELVSQNPAGVSDRLHDLMRKAA
jgi:hypothetical protein